MAKILLRFSREEADVDGYKTKIDKHFTLYDAPASWGGINPDEIFEGYILLKCNHCQELQLINFQNVIPVFSHERQMGVETLYVDSIYPTCCNCGIEESDVDVEFWEYPMNETYIEDIWLNEFEVNLKCTDYMMLLLENIELLDKSSKESFKKEFLETQQLKNNSDELKIEIEKLKSMVNNPNSKEQDFQKFFENNSWMFGVDYIGMTPTKKISEKDIPDFLLEKYDGFYDILDLKLPIPSLFKKVGNKLHPRREVYDGCSQIEYYIGYSNENVKKIQNEIRERIYRPKGILVIGRTNSLEEERLRQFNDDHPKVKIMTYDDIIHKAINILNTIQLCNLNAIEKRILR